MQEFMLNSGMKDPLPYFQRNFWFTTEPESCTFIQDAEFLGWDRLLFATDYSHHSDIGGKNHLHDVEILKNLPVSQCELNQFSSGNYLQLFNRVNLK
jgi:predicted TIM-barrel fold metal-dependent hydrolase